jgi:hypothetical protein
MPSCPKDRPNTMGLEDRTTSFYPGERVAHA